MGVHAPIVVRRPIMNVACRMGVAISGTLSSLTSGVIKSLPR